jgi:hypothetical protein
MTVLMCHLALGVFSWYDPINIELLPNQLNCYRTLISDWFLSTLKIILFAICGLYIGLGIAYTVVFRALTKPWTIAWVNLLGSGCCCFLISILGAALLGVG